MERGEEEEFRPMVARVLTTHRESTFSPRTVGIIIEQRVIRLSFFFSLVFLQLMNTSWVKRERDVDRVRQIGNSLLKIIPLLWTVIALFVIEI